MRTLLDTCVISEIVRPQGAERVKQSVLAIAIRHGFQLMTRNVKDFDGTGARLVNPWANEG